MFVMVQGIVGAYVIRIPVAFFMSQIPGVSLFYIGLCLGFYWLKHKRNRNM